jgi:hypothetical protein
MKNALPRARLPHRARKSRVPKQRKSFLLLFYKKEVLASFTRSKP